MRNAPVIYIVVPCYNEEEVLPLTAEFLGKKLDDLTRSRRIHPGSRVLMVDDGSKDRTWKLIEELHEKDGTVCRCEAEPQPRSSERAFSRAF